MKNMDEIEYLEEYEDLILPTMSSHSTATKNRASNNQLTSNMAEDEDSSSIDQDIFESLFDDHSDDESIMQGKKVPAKLSQRSERSSRVSRMSMDSLDLLVKDLGEPLNAAVDQQSKSTNKPMTKPSNTKTNQSAGKVMPKAATTFAGTTTKPSSTPSNTPKATDNQTANKSEESTTKTSTTDERNAKTKSVATVRPTVQQHSSQVSAKPTNSNAGVTTSSTTAIRTSLSATSACSKQDARESASVSSSGKHTTATITSTSALLPRKQVAAATSTTGSNSNVNASAVIPAKSNRITEHSQTTIVKPEKPQSKDPAEDPLSLENVDNETDSDTESFLYSDISADTFVSLSDVDDDEERQVIELSNDSNYDRVNLDKIRGTTPSPTVSEDDKSEDSSMKVLSKRDDATAEGSALEINANAYNLCSSDVEAPTCSQKIPETTPTKNTEKKTESVDKSPNVSDTNLIERIDTVLSVTNTGEDKHGKEEELAIDVGAEPKVDAKSNITVHEDKNSETPIPPGSETECNNAIDDNNAAASNTTDEGIQEPSKENTTTMDKEMKEGQNDEEFTAKEEIEEGIEKDEEYEEMEEGETEDKGSNAVNTSGESVDNLCNKNNEGIEQLLSEAGGHIVESLEDTNADETSTDVREHNAVEKDYFKNFQELQEEQNSEMVKIIESATPQPEKYTYSTTEENAVEANNEVEKESSNKNNENLEENSGPEQTADSSRPEKDALEAITSEDMKPAEWKEMAKETLKEDEFTPKRSDEKGAEKTAIKEKVKGQYKSDKVHNKVKKTLKDNELTDEISDGNIDEKKDLEEYIKGEPKADEKNTENPGDVEQTVERSDETGALSHSNEKNADILDETLEKEQKEIRELGVEKIINENTEKHTEYAAKSKGNKIQAFETKVDTVYKHKEHAKSAEVESGIERNPENSIIKEETEEHNIKDMNEIENTSEIVCENLKQKQAEVKINESLDVKDENQQIKEKDEMASSSKNAQQLEDKRVSKVETPIKFKRQANRGKKSHTPTRNRKTESISDYDEKSPAEIAIYIDTKPEEIQDREAKKDVGLGRRETAGTKEVKKTRKDESKTKGVKTDETATKRNTKELLQEGRTSSSQSKTRKESNEKNKEDHDKMEESTDEATISGTDKTASETQQRRTRFDEQNLLNPQDENNIERRSRSQTPQSKKITKKVAENPKSLEKPTIQEEKPDEIAVNDNRITGGDQLDDITETQKNEADTATNFDDDQTKQSKISEEKVLNPPLTPKLDRRIRGLVVSLKKTDLSKVLNEKLIRNKEESTGNISTSVSENVSFADKTEAMGKYGTSAGKNKEDSNESLDNSQHVQSVEEDKSKEQHTDTSTKRDSDKRRAQPQETPSKKDKYLEEGTHNAKDAIIANKEELKEENEKCPSDEKDNKKDESEMASTSKSARQKSALKANTRKAKTIESALPEYSADGKKVENVRDTDTESEKTYKTADVIDTIVCADRPKRRRVEAKQQENEKKTEFGTTLNKDPNASAIEIYNKDGSPNQNIEHKASKNLIKNVETNVITESSDAAKEKELLVQSSDKEEMKAAGTPSNITDKKKEEVKSVKNKRSSKTRARASVQTSIRKSVNTVQIAAKSIDTTHPKKADSKMEKQEINETVHNIAEEDTDKTLDQQTDPKVATENTYKTQVKKSEAKIVERTDGSPPATPGSLGTQDRNMESVKVTDDGEDGTQPTIFEPKTLRKRINNALDKTVKTQEVAERKEEGSEAEEVIENNDKAEENIFEPKTLRKRLNNPLDKNVASREKAEGKEDGAEAESVIEDNDKVEENIFEPKMLRKRLNNPLDKKVKPQDLAEGKEEGTEAEEVIEGDGKAEKNIVEPKMLRRRLNNPLDKKVNPQEVAEVNKELTEAEEVFTDNDRAEESIFEPKTLRKRLNNALDKKVKPQEVAEGKEAGTESEEVIKDNDRAEDCIFEPKTLRKRLNISLDKKLKPQEVAEAKEEATEAEEAIENNDKAKENIFEPKTLRRRLNNPIDNKAQPAEVADRKDNLQIQGVPSKTTSKDVHKSNDKTTDAETLEDKDKMEENIVEAKTLRRKGHKKHGNKADDKLVMEKSIEELAVEEVSDSKVLTQEAKTAKKGVNNSLGKTVDFEEVVEDKDETQEVIIEAKTLRKRLNKTLEGIEQQKVVIESVDTTQVKAAEEVSDGKNNTQGGKTIENEIDKLLCKNVESENNEKTQDSIVEPKALRKRAIKHLEMTEEQRLLLAGPGTTREKEAELAKTNINKPLDRKEGAEQLNENVDTAQEEDTTTKKNVGAEIFTDSVDETERTAEDKPTEEKNASTLNTNTEPEAVTESAAKKKPKRLAAKALRDRTKKSVNKKPEPATENANITGESMTEVEVGADNVDDEQEKDGTVTETISDTKIQTFSKDENETAKAVECENKIEEGREAPKVEKESDEATSTEDKNLKHPGSKRPSRRIGQIELSPNEVQESKDYIRKPEDDTKKNDQHEEEVSRYTNTPVPKGNAESEELDVSGSGETARSLRTRHLRQQTEASATTPSPVATPAPSITAGSEDDHEASNRRSLRKRGADQSPSNINELARKGLKATPMSGTNAGTLAQKLKREHLNTNRSLTVTPTSALATRKRGRDIPPHNTTAEKTDPNKSPLEKKTKLESLRKSSRVQNDDAETSESEIEASVSQRRSRLSGVKNNPTNKNIRDNSASLERKATQTSNKQTTDTDYNAISLGSNSPRKRDRAAPFNTNVGKAPITTTTTTDATKKRTKQALDNMQQERQIATKHSDAEANDADVDPLQIPTKRIRRLQGIDGYEIVNANEESNIPKRKSLRAVAAGQSDTPKSHDGNKTQLKQPHQQQQPQHKSLGKKMDSTVEVTATKSGNDEASKSVSTNRSTSSVLKTQTSPTKSSPVSKVLTFTEWLEQQKKNGESNSGEEIATEEVIARHIKANTNTSTTATAAPNNPAVNSKNVPPANFDAEKSNVFIDTSSSKPTDVMNMSLEKELRQRPNVRELRDAIKRKESIMTSPNKAQNVTTNEMAQSSTTVAASRQIRVERTVAHGTNSTNTTNTKSATNRTTQFKRPPLPQKTTARSTTQRAGGNKMPTSMEGNNNSTPQHGKQPSLHKVSMKSKLRKLRVRINRSTVPAYFRKLDLALSRGQVKNDVEQKFLTSTDSALPENTKKEQRQSLPISQNRVPMKSSIQAQKQQLPTLTARPTVAAASSTNNMARLGGSLPALTKVPSSIERTTTRPQDDFNTSNNTASGYQQNNTEELSLLTPMKSVAVPSATTLSRSQQQQQKSQSTSNTAAETIREKRTSATSSTDAVNNTTRTQVNVAAANTNSSFTKDATTAFTPFVPKEEIVDEQQQQQQTSQTISRTSTNTTAAAAADSSTVSTNSLASRTLAIAAATNSALSQPPTGDPSGYYGLTPTQLDSNGTRLYSFLHPAKYNRNHGCVLLDYCCPNLDGPMPAIDPTRIHAQVQAGVRELPAYIVMTTKLITRADLEANKSVIPASIRQKVEKITADAQTVANQMPLPPAAAVNGTPNIQNPLTSKPPTLPTAAGTSASATAKSTLTPTITALQKHLPSTTSITPKLMPPTLTSSSSTSAAAMPTTSTSLNNSTQRGGGTPTTTSSHQMLLSDYQRSLLRTSVRQFDARLKKYYYRIALLSFSDRQKIIDNLITTTTLIPKDVECAVRLLDEYAAQISLLPSPPSVSGGPMNTKSASVVPQALPHQQQQSSASKAVITPTTNTVPIRSNTIQLQQPQRNSNGQGAVLDKDNSLLGYQLASSTSATMELSKSTVSTRSSIMSTGFKNTSMPNVATASGGNLPVLKSAQDSPRIFYTKHPMQTSTPIPTTTSSGNNSMSSSKSISLRSTPRLGREMTVRQIPSKLASVSSTSVTSTPPTTRRLPSLTRNPHLITSNTTTANSPTSETITTRSAVTISTAPKRMTRASAAAKVIVITQNREGGTNTPSDECILPDTHNNTEIKSEKIDDDFVGGN